MRFTYRPEAIQDLLDELHMDVPEVDHGSLPR